MISMSVKTDLDGVVRWLDRRVAPQVPFATAKALTETAKDVQRAENVEIDRAFDRPVPFTQRAIGIAYANKHSLRARVFVKDVQAAYLGLQIAGGERLPKKRALVIPGQDLELNAYGNMPRNKLKQLFARKDTFSGRVRGIEGLWQRVGKQVKLLVLYEPRAQYRKRLDFVGVAKTTVEDKLLPNFRAALKSALATAR